MPSSSMHAAIQDGSYQDAAVSAHDPAGSRAATSMHATIQGGTAFMRVRCSKYARRSTTTRWSCVLAVPSHSARPGTCGECECETLLKAPASHVVGPEAEPTEIVARSAVTVVVGWVGEGETVGDQQLAAACPAPPFLQPWWRLISNAKATKA